MITTQYTALLTYKWMGDTKPISTDKDKEKSPTPTTPKPAIKEPQQDPKIEDPLLPNHGKKEIV